MGIKRLIKNFIRDFRLKKSLKKEDFKLFSTDEIIKNLNSVPCSENPEVSIIIPVYNQIEHTLNCLYSINLAQEKTEFEIIIINDCSADGTLKHLQKIKGLKIISNSDNSGFLKSVNTGILNAKGKYVYLLNNDTLVQNNFLDSLVKTIKTIPETGAVGSKLIYPNNILQEAGCLIFNDRHIVNIGRNQSPYNPEYNFLKKVDYCSGCSLLFNRKDKNGGINLLDEAYAPAYYEETDFCMRLKYQQNLNTYYQPNSVVIHFENISHASEKKSANKSALMQKNADTFYGKWEKYFTEPMVVNNVLNINKNNKKPSVLFVETYFPKFDNDSGANRIVEIMKFIAKNNHKVYLITMNNDHKEESYIKLYESYGIHILREFVDEKGEIQTIKKQLKKHDFFIDKIWISRIETYHYFAKHYQSLLSSKPLLYDMVDFQFLRLKRERDLGLNSITNAELETEKAREMDAINAGSKVIAISETEKDFLIGMGLDAQKIHVISNVHELIQFKPINYSDRKGILFIGGGKHNPNIDAVLYLYEIMQEVWKSEPELVADIIGGDMPEEVTKLNSEKFRIHGFVKNVEPFFKNSKISVAPLRYGAGVKGKIGQALEYSLPVLTTEIGAEGMNLIDEETALISKLSDKNKIARDILRLHTDEELWYKIMNNSAKAIFPFTIEGQKKEIFELLNS